MTWWAWLILGAVLFGAEMIAIDAQFYLVFLGLSAGLVGLAGLAGIDMPEWLQWMATLSRNEACHPAAVRHGPAPRSPGCTPG